MLHSSVAVFSARYFQFHASTTISVFGKKRTWHQPDMLRAWNCGPLENAGNGISAYLKQYLQMCTPVVDSSLQFLCKALGLH